MQTKQDIEKLLAGAGTMPNRRLGQNFLIDLNLMRLLVETAHIQPQDAVIEIGTGTGSFTEELAQRAGQVITVEYDTALAGIARVQLARFSNVQLFNMDVLENKNAIQREILEAMRQAQDDHGGRLLLVANLPYNVGSAVMANLILGPVTADGMYVTVQKEVAERMTARPGHAEYGTLSILMQATGTVRPLRKLPPSVFWPRPQVDSAMVSYERDESMAAQIHSMQIFKQIINLFMNHRRKMLKACVKFAQDDLVCVRHWPDVFEEACVDPHSRPEELTPRQYINIANLCFEQKR
ncbi:MAG: 16S rRNA (adenine(1518)-N(6)/adenine(1519)-N(6))-dimethyltransferase RsmA [Planctomycetaceae bacterium]|nr:16S rRNA (adenine(1518)-N(6)/adenine(1519)-N(6))-dimethyltransferase RsmA [Planctomycetaceae bacterium]